jgi:hypothetical protein
MQAAGVSTLFACLAGHGVVVPHAIAAIPSATFSNTHAADEVDNGGLGGTLVPRGKRIILRESWRMRDGSEGC